MKPEIASLCLRKLRLYSIQFSDPRMVADDGTIQTFNGVLCDLAPVEVCDWNQDLIWYAVSPTPLGLLSLATIAPWPVEEWADVKPGCGWDVTFDCGVKTKRQLVAWLKSQAKGGR